MTNRISYERLAALSVHPCPDRRCAVSGCAWRRAQGRYFAKKEYVPQPLPTFAETKARLPSPIFDDNPVYVQMYWKAWELAFRNFYEPRPGSGFYLERWAGGDACLLPVILPDAPSEPEIPIFVRQTLWVNMCKWTNEGDDGLYRFVCGILGKSPGDSPRMKFSAGCHGLAGIGRVSHYREAVASHSPGLPPAATLGRDRRIASRTPTGFRHGRRRP